MTRKLLAPNTDWTRLMLRKLHKKHNDVKMEKKHASKKSTT